MATDDRARVPAGRREGGRFANENRETAASVSDLAGGEYAPEKANPYADGLPEKPAWLPTDSDIEDTEANRESLLSLARDHAAYYGEPAWANTVSVDDLEYSAPELYGKWMASDDYDPDADTLRPDDYGSGYQAVDHETLLDDAWHMRSDIVQEAYDEDVDDFTGGGSAESLAAITTANGLTVGERERRMAKVAALPDDYEMEWGTPTMLDGTKGDGYVSDVLVCEGGEPVPDRGWEVLRGHRSPYVSGPDNGVFSPDEDASGRQILGWAVAGGYDEAALCEVDDENGEPVGWCVQVRRPDGR